MIVSWLTHDGLPTAQFSRMVSVLQHYITVYIYSAQVTLCMHTHTHTHTHAHTHTHTHTHAHLVIFLSLFSLIVLLYFSTSPWLLELHDMQCTHHFAGMGTVTGI